MLHTSRTRTFPSRVVAVLAASVLLLAACGGGDDDGGSSKSTDGGGGGSLAERCPRDAFEAATGPVEITYWHAMLRENEKVLQQLTDEFNASQDKVRVRIVNQQGYTESLTKYKTVAGTDDAPDLIQVEDTGTQIMVDSGTTIPAQACIDAEGADTSDWLERVVNFYSIGGVLQPVPFNVSNPVFFYNKAAFRTAGLDAEQPPTTTEEVTAAAQALKDAGLEYGMSYKRDAWVLEQFLALYGEPYVNNDNGRAARATEVLFDNETALGIVTWLDDMEAAGLLVSNSNAGSASVNNLLAVCNGESGMTIDTSAALGTAYAVLASGGCPAEVEIGVAPLPVGNGEGGALVGGAANYLVDNGDPARLVASWEFAKFLASAQTQAKWGAGTGYIPISKAAVDSPEMQQVYRDKPGYKVAYDQLTSGEENVATAGPVIGAFAGVRDAVGAALDDFLVGDGTPSDALDRAAQEANDAIAKYNEQVGA